MRWCISDDVDSIFCGKQHAHGVASFGEWYEIGSLPLMMGSTHLVKPSPAGHSWTTERP